MRNAIRYRKNFWSFGKGFETIQISSNSWLISFVGNANTDRVVTRKYVMLKSAELCQKAGYTYFVFNNEQTYLDQVGHFRVGTKASDVLLGSAVVDTETSTVVEVRGLKERPKDQNVLVYDASYIVDHFSVNS